MNDKTPAAGAPPGNQPHPAEGVVQLTKLPLAVVGGILLTALCALVYAVLERQQSAVVAGRAAATDGTGTQSILDASKGYKEIVRGYETQAMTAPAPEDDSDTVDKKASSTGARSLWPHQPPADDERKLAAEKARNDLLRDAIVSSTRVQIGELYALPGSFPDVTSAPLSTLPALALPALSGNEPLTHRIGSLLAAAGQQPPVSDPNLRARKDKYASEAASYGYSLYFRRGPVAPFELKVGTVIPAILTTQINSDLPGMVIAHVSRPVRDTRTGTVVLIPAGSRLIGDYDHHIAAGQRRVLVVWRRVQFPDASTLALDNMPGVDIGGQSGFQDKVDNHYWRTFGSAFLLSVISAASQRSQGDTRAIDARTQERFTTREQLSAELGRQWGAVGRETIKRNLDIQPTLAIRPGFRFNVLVNKDIVLNPYQTW